MKKNETYHLQLYLVQEVIKFEARWKDQFEEKHLAHHITQQLTPEVADLSPS